MSVSLGVSHPCHGTSSNLSTLSSVSSSRLHSSWSPWLRVQPRNPPKDPLRKLPRRERGSTCWRGPPPARWPKRPRLPWSASNYSCNCRTVSRSHGTSPHRHGHSRDMSIGRKEFEAFGEEIYQVYCERQGPQRSIFLPWTITNASSCTHFWIKWRILPGISTIASRNHHRPIMTSRKCIDSRHSNREC